MLDRPPLPANAPRPTESTAPIFTIKAVVETVEKKLPVEDVRQKSNSKLFPLILIALGGPFDEAASR
jgi:hypothetical protein